MRRQISAAELDSLYHKVGACIWHMQYLEHALHHLLVLKVDIRKLGTVDKDQATAMLKKHQRGTLGTSIASAEKHNALPPETITRLRVLKDDRDWLVHRCQNENGTDLYIDSGRERFFERIALIMNRIGRLKSEVVDELDRFCSAAGVSVKSAQALAEKQLAALKGES